MLRLVVSICAVMLAAGPALSNGEEPLLPTDVTWEWVSFTSPVEEIVVDQPDRYTITFDEEGRVAVLADCNRGSGGYTISDGHLISFTPMAVTRALCPPESLSDRFLRELAQVNSFFVRDGDLYLELPVDAGTLRFQPQE